MKLAVHLKKETNFAHLVFFWYIDWRCSTYGLWIEEDSNWAGVHFVA